MAMYITEIALKQSLLYLKVTLVENGEDILKCLMYTNRLMSANCKPGLKRVVVDPSF